MGTHWRERRKFVREGVYRRGSLSDRGFYWRVGEFSERGGGLIVKKVDLWDKERDFQQEELIRERICQKGLGLIRERRVVRQGSLLEKERGKFVGEGWHF